MACEHLSLGLKNIESTHNAMKYSVVIPVFNEKENIRALHAELVVVMERFNEPYEIIVIDDGSTDGTVAVVKTLTPITLIELRKNFGQTAALDAGIKQATGEIIITLDGDGQNPPAEIPKLLAVLDAEDVDVVSGWRMKRKDPLLKRVISRGAHALRNIFVKDLIHDSGCSLKVYRRVCFTNVDLFGEMHRFVPAILRWSGFTISEVPVAHRPRLHGTTKYNWKRIFKGFLDMLAIWFWRKYATRPLHLFGGAGMILIMGGFALACILAVRKFAFHIPLAQSNLPLMAVLLVIVGVQLFVSGILADIAIRNYYRDKRMPYLIKRVTSTTK